MPARYPDTVESYFHAFKEGREKGFDYFYNHYYKRLTFFAYRLLNDTSQAEDVVTDVFITIWNKRDRLKEVAQIKSLLYTSVKNACIDLLRKDKRRDTAQLQIAYLSKADLERVVLDKMIEAEVTNELYTAMQRLPPRCRDVFVLFYIHKMSFKEIAATLKISVTTVKSQKERALEILRKKMPRVLLLLLVLEHCGNKFDYPSLSLINTG